MTRITLFISIFTIIFLPSIAQSDLQKRCQQVLEKNKIDSSFSFNASNKKDEYAKTFITYLGTVTTTHGRILKIITYKFIWGPNRHSSAGIYIFNAKNQYMGRYYVGGTVDLPTQLINDTLIFTNEDNDSCDKKLITRINLKIGLPKVIFIKCQGVYGDLYGFSSDE